MVRVGVIAEMSGVAESTGLAYGGDDVPVGALVAVVNEQLPLKALALAVRPSVSRAGNRARPDRTNRP